MGRKFVPEESLRGCEPGWGAADAGVRGKVGDGGHVPAEKGSPRPTPGKPTQEGLQVPAVFALEGGAEAGGLRQGLRKKRWLGAEAVKLKGTRSEAGRSEAAGVC